MTMCRKPLYIYAHDAQWGSMPLADCLFGCDMVLATAPPHHLCRILQQTWKTHPQWDDQHRELSHPLQSAAVPERWLRQVHGAQVPECCQAAKLLINR